MIRLENLRLSFDSPSKQRRRILDIDEQEFPSGGLIGIKGPSGVGKTTLLNVISLLERPQEGKIVFRGEDILSYGRRKSCAFRKEHIGYLRQSAELLPHLTVLDNVLLPTSFYLPSEKKKAKERARSLLADFGVAAHEKSYPTTLSGGEAARVALARAMQNEPDILLADEPTDALDEPEAHRLMGYLKEASKKSLVIIVSHDERILEKYCDSILNLSEGKLRGEIAQKADNPPKNVKNHANPLSFFALGWKRVCRTKVKKVFTILISSFGFMGVALSLGFNNGSNYISKQMEETLLKYAPMTAPPLYINATGDFDVLNPSTLLTDKPYVYVEEKSSSEIHFNVFRQQFVDYLKANLKEDEYRLEEATTASILRKDGDAFSFFSAGSTSSGDLVGGYLSSFYGESPALTPIYEPFSNLPSHFDCIAGNYPSNDGDIFLVVKEDNGVSTEQARLLGLSQGAVNVSEIVGREFKFLPNDSVYRKRSLGKTVTARFVKSNEELKKMDLPASAIISYAASAVLAYQKGDAEASKEYVDKIDAMFGEEETRELFAYSLIAGEEALSKLYDDQNVGKKVRIAGILRPKASLYFTFLNPGIYYGQGLNAYMKEMNRSSEVAKEIQSHLVFSRSDYTLSFPYAYSFLNEVKEKGQSDIVEAIRSLYEYFLYRAGFNVDETSNKIVFPLCDYKDAKRITSLIDSYNEAKPEWEQIKYNEVGYGYFESLEGYFSLSDRASMAIFFVVAIAHTLIVSLFVFLDTKGRKREIGLYATMGATSPQIAAVFLSESVFTGMGVAACGLGVAYAALAAFNRVVEGSIGISVVIGFARLSFLNAFGLVLFFVALMLISTFVATLYYGLARPSAALRQES